MFVSELRSLADHCNFENTLEVMLRDHLVCGINDPNKQCRLLSEVNLTFQKAFEIAQGQESAVQYSKGDSLGGKDSYYSCILFPLWEE